MPRPDLDTKETAMEKITPWDDEPSERFPVFTRGNVAEVFSQVLSPLTWSTFSYDAWELAWRDALVAIGAFTPDEFREGSCEVIGSFGGYVYLNCSASRLLGVRAPGLTWEAIDQSFFGDVGVAPPYRPDPCDEDAARTEALGGWIVGMLTAPDTSRLEEDRRRVEAAVAARPDLTSASAADLVERFRSMVGQMRDMFATHIYMTYCSNVLSGVVLQVAAAVEAPELASAVTAGVGDVDSARASFELWDLSRRARASDVVREALSADPSGAPARWRSSGDEAAAAFAEDWDAFVLRWHMLGESVWEMRSPTYGSDPTIPLRMLAATTRAEDDASPAAKTDGLAAEREKAVAVISERLAADPDTQGQFLGAAQAATVYLPGRERSKLLCTRVAEEARAALRTLGGRLVETGHLPRWQDLLLVTADELDGFLADPAAHAELLDERRRLVSTLEAKVPPFVFEGDAPTLDAFTDRGTGTVDAAGGGDVLAGLGVSPGTHTGRARVLTSLDVDEELDPDDVIVAVTTDSAWGPLFLAAGAVVCEQGATISHAAIVSRELGLPAVVGVADAVRRIPDGAMVTVDGGAGTVTVS